MTASLRFREQTAPFAQKIFDDVRELSRSQLGVTRLGYSETETKVMRYIEDVAKNMGLETEYDLAGNLWMILPGKHRDLPAVVAGSHADSVPEGGNYDGLAGVTAAMAVARWLKNEGIVLDRDLRVNCFRCEERGLFGSLGLCGRLKEQDLQRRYGDKTLAESIAACGLDPQRLTTGVPVMDLKKLGAYIEIHIDQSPKLDSLPDTRVGLVTGIRGCYFHLASKCIGETAHAGAIEYDRRHDALMAASTFFVRAREKWHARVLKGEDLVFTVGVCNTPPFAALNIIPGEVTFSVDIRTLSHETCQSFTEEFYAEAKKVEEEFGVRFEFDKPMYTPPAICNAQLMHKLQAAADRINVKMLRMASGAGHDGMAIDQAGIPMAMLFVANQNGSHNPHEDMQMDDFLMAADVLREMIEQFDQ